MEQALDRRIRRTKGQLCEALIELLGRQELRDIKVSELCKRADIGRGTFYLHYKDIGDFYRQVENTLFAQLQTILETYFPQGSRPMLDEGIEAIFRFLAENADVCAAILSQRESTLVERILTCWKPQEDAAWEALLGPIPPCEREETYTFITQGAVGIIRSWYTGGMKKSPAAMARTLNRLIGRCSALTEPASPSGGTD